MTQSLAEPVVTTQSITPPARRRRKPRRSRPSNRAKSSARAPGQATSPPSKPVTPQLAAPKPAAPRPATLQAAAFADLPGWQADSRLAALENSSSNPDGRRGYRRRAGRCGIGHAGRCLRQQCAIESPTKASAKAFEIPLRAEPRDPQGELRSADRLLRAGARRLAHTRRALPDADLPAAARSPQRRRRDAACREERRRARIYARPTLAPNPTTRRDQAGGARQQGARASLPRRSRRRVSHAHPGFAHIHLTDGTTTRVNNSEKGHPYTSDRRCRVEKGLLNTDKV